MFSFLAGKKIPEINDEEEETELPTIPQMPREPGPMPDPCSAELDAMMLGEALPLHAVGKQWEQPVNLETWKMGMT